MKKVVVKSKKFSGFSVLLRNGSKKKKRLSNHLEIEVASDRTVASHKMTIREARALQKWLNENLDQPAQSAAPESA